MKAIVLHEYGDPDVLRFEEVATPGPGPGEVLIKVHNVSVNITLDIILRKGFYPMKPTLPHVMGTDPVGEVVALGDGVAKPFKPGDRIATHTPMPGRVGAGDGRDGRARELLRPGRQAHGGDGDRGRRRR